LKTVSAANGLDWSFLLAVLRAERLSGSGQVNLHALQHEAAILEPLHLRRGDRQTLLAYKDDPLFADRVLALKHYYSALGLAAQVKGLTATTATSRPPTIAAARRSRRPPASRGS